jgi:hypothetical protein
MEQQHCLTFFSVELDNTQTILYLTVKLPSIEILSVYFFRIFLIVEGSLGVSK